MFQKLLDAMKRGQQFIHYSQAGNFIIAGWNGAAWELTFYRNHFIPAARREEIVVDWDFAKRLNSFAVPAGWAVIDNPDESTQDGV